ncbi:hypothetical protein LAZ67_16001702 [Cordylochernes scorpioides]|uniref:Transposase n=1 Tax=Cordylochernes scorpioides TaxID=51811 RepID=A0ABY6LBD9_9ARAC|nr:hypothetical protein LAZ67_16001702 [Cordylochernes scorpioides]
MKKVIVALACDIFDTRLETVVANNERALERYEIEREGFLDRIVTGDESWIHHYIPDSKRSSAEWHHKDYLSKDQTVNRLVYSELLEKYIKPNIRFKRRGLLSKGLQHDNARPHVSNLIIEAINKLNFKVIILIYSPDLGPSEYYSFGYLKIFLKGMTFKTDDEVENAGHG